MPNKPYLDDRTLRIIGYVALAIGCLGAVIMLLSAIRTLASGVVARDPVGLIILLVVALLFGGIAYVGYKLVRMNGRELRATSGDEEKPHAAMGILTAAVSAVSGAAAKVADGASDVAHRVKGSLSKDSEGADEAVWADDELADEAHDDQDEPLQAAPSANSEAGWMTGQLVARYKATRDRHLRDEYLRRLQLLGFDEAEATSLFTLELTMLKGSSAAALSDPGYLQSGCFDLQNVLLAEDEAYYVEHQSFLVSEIVKIWDEAEWHYWYSRGREMPQPVWAEIFALSRYGGGQLLVDYLTSVSEHAEVPLEKVQAYAAAEQQLLFAYKWGRSQDERDPYEA